MDIILFLKKYKLNNNNFNNIKYYLENYLKHKNNLKLFYKNDKKFRKLAFDTNFLFCNIMSDFMKELYGLNTFDISNKLIFKNIKNSFGEINNKLNQDGYFITNIDEKICDNIVKKLDNFKFIDRITNKLLNYKDINKNKKYGNTFWINKMSDVLNTNEIINLITDTTLLQIVQNFLGCKPILTQTNLWKSINNSFDDIKLSKSAQLFHRDFDNEKWLKIFIYLNDININNGPHCYVKGSQNKIINNKITRESDNFIKNNYNPNDIIYHCGKKGTVIFENTRGYHKGTPVINDERLILQLEFAINPYCFKGCGDNFNLLNNNKFIKKNPYIYKLI